MAVTLYRQVGKGKNRRYQKVNLGRGRRPADLTGPYFLRYSLADGTWDEQREAFGDAVVNTIAEHAPNLPRIIRHRQVLTPLDLEREFGLSEGNIFQGELTLEQLFFLRPAPGWAKYETPLRNLWMCGSATHPGGGVMGAPGRNAARRILGQDR